MIPALRIRVERELVWASTVRQADCTELRESWSQGMKVIPTSGAIRCTVEMTVSAEVVERPVKKMCEGL